MGVDVDVCVGMGAVGGVSVGVLAVACCEVPLVK